MTLSSCYIDGPVAKAKQYLVPTVEYDSVMMN
jgi:hypothetical protein